MTKLTALFVVDLSPEICFGLRNSHHTPFFLAIFWISVESVETAIQSKNLFFFRDLIVFSTNDIPLTLTKFFF